MSDGTDSLSWHPQGDDFAYLLGAGIGTTATDLLFNGQGTVSPVIPDFLVLRVKNATLTERSGKVSLLTIQAYSLVAGLPTPVVIKTIDLAASTSVILDDTQFADVIPPGYGLQAYVSAGSADVSLLCYQQKG